MTGPRTSRVPSFDRKRFRTALRRSFVAGVVAVTTIALGGIGALPPASAAAGDTSAASARFLAGSLLLDGVSLDDVVALGGVSASNPGGAPPDIQSSSLDLTALNLLTVSLPNGVSVPLGTLLQLGAVNQYAEADDNGISRAASGAVSDTGAVDTTGGGTYPADATLDLVSILGPLAGTGVLDTATLTANAVTAVAALDASDLGALATSCTDLSDPSHCRDYNVASATIDLDSPLVGTMVADINTALGAVSTTLNTTLETSILQGVLDGVSSVLDLINAVLPGVSLVSNTLTVTVNADLQAAVASVLNQTLSDGVVSINLSTGEIDVDLDALTGGLNGLAPNTSVLTAAVVTNLVDRIGVLLGNGPTGLQTQLATAVDAALDAVTVSIGGGICLLELLGSCTAGLTVTYNGTLGALAGGSAPITVAGTGLLAALMVGPLLTSVVGALQTTLAGLVSPVLATGLSDVTTAAASAVNDLITALGPVLLALNDVLLLTANVQEQGSAGAGSYREVALRVSLLDGVGATLDLARAEVGANDIVPSITSLDPDHGPLIGANTVTVHGAHFVTGTTVTFNGNSVTPDSIAPDGTSLTFTVPAGLVSGPVEVTVTNVYGTSDPMSYTYDPPTLDAGTSVRPGDPLPLTSSGWTANTGVTVDVFALDGTTVIATTTVTTNASGEFPAATTITIPGDAELGTHTVTASDAAGDEASDTFEVADVAATDLQPDAGPVAGGQTVTIYGLGFTGDSTVNVDGGAPITPDSIDPGGTWLTYTTPAHAAGPVDVTVTTAAGTSNPLTYTYVPVPLASSLDPDAGPVAGGQTVTITGTYFTSDSIVTLDGGDITPSSVAPDGLSLTFVTPPHAAGPVDVTVTTPGGTSTPALTYTYVPVPTSSSLDPDAGPVTGGQTVTITGTGFTSDSVVTIGGTDVTPDSVDPGGTSLTFTTPAHAAGPVDVTVTTPGGTTDPLAYTYYDLPTASSINPDAGPASGGQTVTITGTGFAAGVTSVTIGGNVVAPGDVTVVNSTTLTLLTPAHAAGPVDVTVTTPGGTSTPALDYTYLDAPTASALDPDAGPVAGGQTVTITGTDFTADSTVTIGGTDVAPASVDPGGTSLTFVTPAHAAGPVDVTVTTPGGTTAPPLTYTYLDVPTATALDPDAGPIAGGQTVTITGTDFTADSTVTIGGTDVAPASVDPGGTSLTFVTPAHAAGPVDVTVTTPGGTTDPLTYTYVGVPTATAIDPDAGPVAGGQTVTITGTGFTDDSTVSIGGNPCVVIDVAADGTWLTCTTPAGLAGPALVIVTTPGGSTAPLTYTYVDVPSASSLDPDSGPVAGGQTVTVEGMWFTDDSVVTIGGIEVTPTAVDILGTWLTFVTPAHAAGEVDVTVTTPGGTTDPLAYTYLAVPTASSLDPDSGPVAGGTTVTISGTGFTADSVVSVDGVDITPDSVDPSGTSLTFTTPAHAAGPVDVTVTTPGGTTAALTYTYLDPPTAVSLNPDEGPTSGGQTVTITGTNFTDDSVVSVDGTDVVASSVDPDGTSLTFVTPAHAAGAVDVTVTTPGGTTAPALIYTYVPAPTAATIDPDAGPVAGGQTVTITGTNFTPDSTVTIGGIDVVASSVDPGGTSLTFVTPAHASGAVEVTVTTPGGTTDPLTYTYVGVPVASALNPDAGPIAGGQTVTISGQNFTADSVVTIGGDVVAPASVAPNGTSLTFVTPAHAAGEVVVTVTTPGGTSNELIYTYVPPPTALSMDPTYGPDTGGQLVTITGTNFTDDSIVTIGGIDVTPSDVATAGTSLTFITPAHAAGAVDVTVTTPGGTTDAMTYTYIPVPVASSIDPDEGPVTGGQTVTITGRNFTAGSVVTIGGIAVTPTSVAAAGTSLTFVTPAHAAGPVTVTVTTTDGTSDPLTYTYVPLPVASLLDPDEGPETGGQLVTITGSGFTADSRVTIGGKTVVPEDVAADGLSLTFVTPAHAPGAVDVTVRTAGGTTEALTYTYLPSDEVPEPPVITDPVDGDTVTDPTPPIRGTGDPGATIDVIENGEVICTSTVDSDRTWTCTPSSDLTPGEHIITARQTRDGLTSDLADPVTFTVALDPPADPADPASTGADVRTALIVAGLVLLLGIGLATAGVGAVRRKPLT